MANVPFKLKSQPANVLTIYGDSPRLSAFLNMSAFEPVAAVPRATATANVAGHRRKRYPGHVGVAVSPHARTYLKGSDAPGGGAVPGNKFWMERKVQPPGDVAPEVRGVAFSYTGTWKALRAAVIANATGTAFKLRNSSGRSVVVAASATP